MVLYPKDPHYKIFDIAPATAIMIGISPPEGKKKGRLPFFTRMDSQTRLPSSSPTVWSLTSVGTIMRPSRGSFLRKPWLSISSLLYSPSPFSLPGLFQTDCFTLQLTGFICCFSRDMPFLLHLISVVQAIKRLWNQLMMFFSFPKCMATKSANLELFLLNLSFQLCSSCLKHH